MYDDQWAIFAQVFFHEICCQMFTMFCFINTHVCSGVNASSRLGDEVMKRVECGEGVLPPSPENFLFCDLEMAYFGEFWGAKFKVCNNIGEDIPIDVPKPKYWWGCVPGIPGGVDASAVHVCGFYSTGGVTSLLSTVTLGHAESTWRNLLGSLQQVCTNVQTGWMSSHPVA